MKNFFFKKSITLLLIILFFSNTIQSEIPNLKTQQIQIDHQNLAPSSHLKLELTPDEKPPPFLKVLGWIIKKHPFQIAFISIYYLTTPFWISFFPENIQMFIKMTVVLGIDVWLAIHADRLLQRGMKKDKGHYDPIQGKLMTWVHILTRPIRVIWLAYLGQTTAFIYSLFNFSFNENSLNSIYNPILNIISNIKPSLDLDNLYMIGDNIYTFLKFLLFTFSRFALDTFPFMFVYFFICSIIMIAVMSVISKGFIKTIQQILSNILSPHKAREFIINQLKNAIPKAKGNAKLAIKFILPSMILFPSNVVIFPILLINFFGFILISYLLNITRNQNSQLTIKFTENEVEHLKKIADPNLRFKSLLGLIADRTYLDINQLSKDNQININDFILKNFTTHSS